MGISTHVLDLSSGTPAEGIPVKLERREQGGGWRLLEEAVTDADGRVKDLLPAGEALAADVHRLTFATETYLGPDAFYPEAAVVFRVKDAAAHYHIPLLLSPFGYSTYRGS